ncbi:MAG: nucleoside-diphosphate sugar epimerase/dehydratase [Crocinitomicaceae bacterium]|nr:nucleoside-diphosphate sugar epimerase/dehydratase [Crocinitomicaceae bacterium]
MIHLKSNTPRWVISLNDLVISIISLAIAYLIRFDFSTNSEEILNEWHVLVKSLPLFILIKVIVFNAFQVQKGLVRYTSSEDLKRILLALTSCSLLFFFFGLLRKYFFDGYFLFPSSVLIMEYFVSFFLMLGTRFTVKLIYLESIKSKDAKERVLIYGAGISGLITKRTIENDVLISYSIIGYIDDNEKMRGTRLEGMKIFHTSELEKLIKEEGVTQLIIAIQNPDKENRKEVVDICLNHKVNVQQVPRPTSWINGEFSAKQINKIKIEDLLGRKPIVLSTDKIAKELNHKTILVTGAAGSIGSGIVEQIAHYQPKKIILFDQAESALYDLQNQLYLNYPELNFTVIIGDICNKERLNHLFSVYKPNYIFHAAAYKHVPLMEENPSEAVSTNVRGTQQLVDFALEYKVEKFIMISTDKAVNPTNVMGASKRIAEIYAQSKSGLGTKFITTRFGNVLGSNGSVIPLFQRQIDNGGPITVTDPNVTRFFMTIPEACQLVLEASSMGEGGEIFVFDMGDSVKIIDLAKKMIQLSGLELGKDIEIKYTGLRPGEKLYEEVLSDEEQTIPTHHPQILIAKIRAQNQHVLELIETLIEDKYDQNNLHLVKKMKEIVPEFISNNSEFSKLDKND